MMSSNFYARPSSRRHLNITWIAGFLHIQAIRGHRSGRGALYIFDLHGKYFPYQYLPVVYSIQTRRANEQTIWSRNFLSLSFLEKEHVHSFLAFGAEALGGVLVGNF